MAASVSPESKESRPTQYITHQDLWQKATVTGLSPLLLDWVDIDTSHLGTSEAPWGGYLFQLAKTEHLGRHLGNLVSNHFTVT
jgi:hypothetical protein